MRHVKILGVCLMGALAMSVTAATPALAKEGR